MPSVPGFGVRDRVTLVLRFGVCDNVTPVPRFGVRDRVTLAPRSGACDRVTLVPQCGACDGAPGPECPRGGGGAAAVPAVPGRWQQRPRCGPGVPWRRDEQSAVEQ